MNYKCAKCGFECKNIATALEHRDFYNGVGCGGDIVTSSTIDEWNDIYAKP